MKGINHLKVIGFLVVSIVIVFGAGASHAAIVGELWQNQGAIVGNATLANVPATPPDAKFNPAAIDYNSNVTGYTPALFLNNPAFFDTSGSFNPNASLNNTFFFFTGQVFLNAGNNSFVVAHDDGLQLNIDTIGLVVDAPGPTAPVFTPFNVVAPADGLYNFELSYGECCGPPAVLSWAINQQPVGNGEVPEPATMLLLGSGLVGAGLYRRLRKPKG